MKINWKLRLQNKASLTAILLAIVSLVYQILAVCGVVPGVSEETVVNIISAVINVLLLMGIVVDPTTEGLADSERALGYEEPYKRSRGDE